MTFKPFVVSLLALVVSSSIGLRAAEKEKPTTFPAAYISGHAGLKSFEALLSIEGGAVRLATVGFKSRLKLAIPLATITEVQATTELEHDSPFTNSMINLEYITITVETRESAEAIMIRVRQHQAADIAAKINFARRQATTDANP